MSLSELNQAIDALRNSVQAGASSAIKEQLRTLKAAVVKVPSMPPSFVSDQRELAAIRNAYEVALGANIATENIVGIQQCFEMLKCLYVDSPAAPQDDSVWDTLGLYLTYLLSFNYITEFHTELELIPYEWRSNKSVSFSIRLEQYFMEGNYKQVSAAKELAPGPQFAFFVNRIVDTIRYEIAASIETSYQQLNLSSVLELLKLANEEELRRFLENFSKREGTYEWVITAQRVEIRSTSQDVKEIPKWELISQAVGYAVELERIV